SQRHVRVAEVGTGGGRSPRDSGALEPTGEVDAPGMVPEDVVVDERHTQQLLGLLEAMPVPELRTAHGEDPLGPEPGCLEPRIVARAVANAHVDVLSSRIRQTVVGKDVDLQIRDLGLEVWKI